VAERPGGATISHRQVRRDEELVWLKNHGFGRVVSILPVIPAASSYADHGLTTAHFALRGGPQQRDVLEACYLDVHRALTNKTVVLLHSDEVSDRLLGVVAGYLVWSGKVPSVPTAVALTERLFKRSIGPDGREIVFDLPVRHA
jgi:hypothetical protein